MPKVLVNLSPVVTIAIALLGKLLDWMQIQSLTRREKFRCVRN